MEALSALWAFPAIVIAGLTAVAVAVTLGRPVLFRQRRAGLGTKAFTLYKFRTMSEATDREGRPLPVSIVTFPTGLMPECYRFEEES